MRLLCCDTVGLIYEKMKYNSTRRSWRSVGASIWVSFFTLEISTFVIIRSVVVPGLLPGLLPFCSLLVGAWRWAFRLLSRVWGWSLTSRLAACRFGSYLLFPFERLYLLSHALASRRRGRYQLCP